MMRERPPDSREACAKLRDPGLAPARTALHNEPSRPEPRGAVRPVTLVIAIDVGGTAMKCALVSPTGQIVHAERHPTGADRGPDSVVATILDVAAGLTDTA